MVNPLYDNLRHSLEFQVIDQLATSVTWSSSGDALNVHVPAHALSGVCDALAKTGAVFDSAVCASPTTSKTIQIVYAFRMPALKAWAFVLSHGDGFSSVSARLPAAVWDERKLADGFGVSFENAPDTRPLLAHPESGWTSFASHVSKNKNLRLGPSSEYADQLYPIQGTNTPGEFEIPVGPVHAGVIEPGHFRFFVVGETIQRMETRMFYLHRGLERQAEGKKPEELVPLMEQASGDESVANAVAFCQAAETLSGKAPSARAQSLRLVFAEMERIHSHLADLGGMATDVGYYGSASQFSMLREEVMRLNQRVSGNRFLRGLVVPGGVSQDLAPEQKKDLLDSLGSFSKKLDDLSNMTFSSSTFLDRVFGAGRVSKTVALELALVGPVARASGVPCDLRAQFPYGAYAGRSVSETLASAGDVLARFNVKLNEVSQSVRLVQQGLRRLGAGPLRVPVSVRDGLGHGYCEAPRGACSVFLVLRDGRVSRLSLRTASFRNWRGIEKAVEGNIVPDFPLINKSFNLSYAGTDL